MPTVTPAAEGTPRAPRGIDVLATKLAPRPARANLVARPRVTALLDAAAPAGLILVSAPAGFGKTTLLAEWLRTGAFRAAWLSLDAADNDPARFLACVIAALQRVIPGVAGDLLAPLRSDQPPEASSAMGGLVAALAAEDEPAPLVLVLDDYHAITAPAVHAAVTLLLDNLPPHVHLVISTRSDPPVPIARLRSRGQVVEIRADELRFTPDEAAAFLRETMSLDLSPAQVAALDERAEGWIAGLQMAALSMRGREDVDGFIRAFSGTHRYIMDFVLEEVLAREPEEVQAFLLRTSVLNRLSGPLCDAVTGTTGGQGMLERLERRNLFMVPLDDDRRWYRYHHLFADLLRARLAHLGPEAVAPLLARAARWCEGDGQAEDAVAYALESRDHDLAAGLIAAHAHAAIANGQIETVAGWLESLPEGLIDERAELGVLRCWVLWLKAQVGAVEACLVRAERAIDRLPVPDPAGREYGAYAALQAQAAALHSFVAKYAGDNDAAIAHAQHAAALVPRDAPGEGAAQLRSLAYLALASACDAAGHLEEAVDAYRETVRLSAIGASAVGVAGMTYRLVGALRVLGRLREADDACRLAEASLAERGLAHVPAAGLLRVTMGDLLIERNDLAAAEASLREGIESGRGSGRLNSALNAAPSLMRLHLARGDAAAAMAAVTEAQGTPAEPLPDLARAAVLALRARVLLRQGADAAVAEAAACVEAAQRLAGADRGQSHEDVALVALRLHLAQERPGVLDELASAVAAAEQAGRTGTAIEALTLRSLALERRGAAREAERDLERALALAEPEGYVRLFVDEGPALAAVLRRVAGRRAETGAPPSPGYVAMLLAALDGSEPGGGTARQPSHDALIEPLTPRELEVLRLICAGHSNREIADRLVVTVSAVKKHAGNILGKLGVASRTQAMVKARQLGLCDREA